MTHMKYSVLMSVYYKEKAENLASAMQSIFAQTVKPEDFVLVCDGPLTEPLDKVIDKISADHSELHVVRLKENVGLGRALNEGIRHCKNEIVARMDSDDVSRPDRCERQLKVLSDNPQIGIISGTIEEFSDSIDVIDSRRTLPQTHDEIVKFAQRRNPFNHPCVMYKKSLVKAAGGYQDFYLLEDYYLWIRMLQTGAVGYNLQEPLLWMRAGSDMYKRRAGWKYAKSQRGLFKYMMSTGFINRKQYVENMIIRTGSSMAPNWVRRRMFYRYVRK